MPDQWTIRGQDFVNCNCDWGCPCQCNSPSTHGSCEAVVAGHIDEGHFNDVRLDGLDWIMLVQWPGEIADGNGKEQFIIDERADAAQREGLSKILHGESTAPGSTHFFVYNSTMSKVLDTLYAPIELSIDVEARKARLSIPGIIQSQGNPIINPNSGEESRARIHLPNGFEYTYAEMGSATSTITAGIKLDFADSYAQFNLLHMNQDGVIR